MKVKSMALSFEAYLKSLEMKIDIHEAFQSELSRLAELTQRTNKCTNGVRYSFEELRKIWEGGISIYSVSITDKFSNLGIVGILVICDKRLEAFALSCRALGRGVEEQMMKYCKNNGVLTYRFNETRKNIELDKRLSSCFRRDA